MSYFESPVFRSVLIETPQAPTRWPSSRERKDFVNESKEETTRPSVLQRWTSSTPLVLENPTCCYEQQHATSFTNEWPVRRWVWKLEKVPDLPMFYPLQEWNTLKVDNMALSAISTRISEFLRLHSIETSYDDNEGSVSCRTFSGVEFVINIWNARNRTTSSEATFLIHIQHTNGCSMEMQCLRSDIRSYIISSETTPLHLNSGNQLSNNMLRSREVPEVDTAGIELTVEGVAREAPLEFCRSMLNSELWSEKRLGLESLHALTDRSKTTSDAVQEACNAVLSDSSLQDLLKEHLENFDSKNDYNDRRRNRILVLQILARSLVETRNTNNKRRTKSYMKNNKFWESTVLSAAIDNIQNASNRPLEASLSARCLLELLDCIYALSFTTDLNNLQEHILNAIEFGRLHNASLEVDTRRLLCHFEAIQAQ